MPYATLEEMLGRFDRPGNPELSQLTADADGLRDDARIDEALAEATGQMDLYIGTRYALPLAGLAASQSEELARLCCDIARYRLWADASSEEVRRRYEEALKLLDKIAAGDILLIVPTPGAGVASASAEPRLMTRAALRGVI
jgi:phage gp36-like protein